MRKNIFNCLFFISFITQGCAQSKSVIMPELKNEEEKQQFAEQLASFKKLDTIPFNWLGFNEKDSLTPPTKTYGRYILNKIEPDLYFLDVVKEGFVIKEHRPNILTYHQNRNQPNPGRVIKIEFYNENKVLINTIEPEKINPYTEAKYPNIERGVLRWSNLAAQVSP